MKSLFDTEAAWSLAILGFILSVYTAIVLYQPRIPTELKTAAPEGATSRAAASASSGSPSSH